MPSPTHFIGFRAFRMLAVAIVLHTAAAMPAAAQQLNELTGEQREACAADFKRLCPGQLPGGGRVRQCFAENVEQLSPLCQEAAIASGAIELPPSS